MTEHRLPVQQLVILSICRFAEPIALTSVFPYVPELMESFGVPENDIARWAGVISATFSICQALTGLLWGAASDRYGRKPIILFGLFNTMWAMLLWGFSTSLPMALVARALQGLTNGNVGILRTTVAELCPWKELQPRAFSIMPLVFTVGAIFGPTLGGALSNPLGVDPRKPRGSRFLEHFPYILPNLVAASFFTIGIVVGWLFLKETLESKRNQPDLGLRTGARITAFARKIFRITKKRKEVPSENQPLLGQRKVLEDEATVRLGVASEIIKPESPKVRDVLTYQTTLNLVVYAFLALYTLAYDQLLPVFLHHPPQSLDSPDVQLPLKFAGGFGMDSRRIGAIFTFFSISSTISQFFIFPPLARYLGVLQCLRLSFLIFPFVFFITPFVSVIPDPMTREVAIVVLLAIRGMAGTLAFPTSTIMLTNSASSLRVLGTVNGLATSVSAVGQAIGPTVGGGLFTWGVKRGYIIVPFWTMCVISLLAAVPTFMLVDGKGFGDDADSDEESSSLLTDDDVDEEEIRSGSSRVDLERVLSVESEFGELGEPANLLSYATTRSSAVIASDDGADNERDKGFGNRRSYSSNLDRTRSRSQGRRRLSVPIGMGRGFRRYSSNLGSTGIGTGGTSWGGC